MTEHYYSKKPSVESKETNFDAVICGHNMRFLSDQGVFSKDGIDFGSRLLAETILRLTDTGSVNNQRWLDLGCGYGAMGVTLAKCFPQVNFTLVDINERAVELARKNALTSGIPNLVVHQSDGYSAVGGQRFNRIFTNPPIRAGKQMIHQWFEDAVQHLQPQGELWIVIQKKQGAPSALKKLESVFRTVEELERDKGYFILRGIL